MEHPYCQLALSRWPLQLLWPRAARIEQGAMLGDVDNVQPKFEDGKPPTV